MHVAVCIVGYRDAADIVACLGALTDSTYGDFEVQICENGGADAYGALVEAIPARLSGGQPVAIIEAPRNLGYAGGVNVCLRASPDADAWWILNPDTRPDAAALDALVVRLTRQDCELVGGVLYGADNLVQTLGGRWRPWLARAKLIGRGWPVAHPPPAADVQLDFVSGASMLVGKAFVDRVGLMREDYFLYCEEVEWCLRGRARGMRLGFAADARILHDQGGTTGSARPLTEQAAATDLSRRAEQDPRHARLLSGPAARRGTGGAGPDRPAVRGTGSLAAGDIRAAGMVGRRDERARSAQ